MAMAMAMAMAMDATELAVFVLAAAAVLHAYIETLHLGLPGGDAGELLSTVCTGGVAHPPVGGRVRAGALATEQAASPLLGAVLAGRRAIRCGRS